MSLKAAVRDYFTEKQLLFMEPYLPKLALSATEEKWITDSRAFRTEEKIVEERRKTEELSRARQTAEREKQLREAAESQQRRAKQRSRIAISVALVALITTIVAWWQYQEGEKQRKIAEEQTKRSRKTIETIVNLGYKTASNGI
jgi:hypothetical protein